MYSLSLSKNSTSLSTDQHKYFSTRECTWDDIESVVVSSAWSSIVWKGGARDGLNFTSASLAVLDFDSGLWTIGDAVAYAEDLGVRYIVGTTKSHQKEKNKVVCDRFRLIFDFVPCAKVSDYTWTMKQLTDSINLESRGKVKICDSSCNNASRFFFPCVEIVASGSGKRFPVIASKWEEYRADIGKEKKHRAYRRGLINGDFNLLPTWVKGLIFKGNHIGRSDALWRASRFMHDAGFDSEEIYTYLKRIGSPLLTMDEDEYQGKVMEVVRNGDKYGNNYFT